MQIKKSNNNFKKLLNYNFLFQSSDLSVFETNIRFVGGLLTCFALTGDIMFRDKAELVAQKLLPAFQTQTGIPYALINIKTGVSNKLISIFNFKNII